MGGLNMAAGCAECGKGGIGLMMCNSCKHINYCSVTCQKQHWPKHKKECKQRAARLRDESLFKQPPPKDGCPICFLPMPFAYDGMASFYPCCGKIVCNGCHYSNHISGNRKCPFCNSNVNSDNEIEQVKKRVEANDVIALTELGCFYANGSHGLRKDWDVAFELWTRAAELGSSRARYAIGATYLRERMEKIDRKNAKHHFELAAMAGHEMARYSLGFNEYNSGNVERSIKHWMISASAGHNDSMTVIKQEFERKLVQSDAYELTLKTHDDSLAEMRSQARDDAAHTLHNRVLRV